MEYKKIIEESGAKYIGIQKGWNGTPSMILFNAPSGSTLSVNVNLCSMEKVKEKLLEHEKEYRSGC